MALDRDRARRRLVTNLGNGLATSFSVGAAGGIRRAVSEMGNDLAKEIRDLSKLLDARQIPDSLLLETNMRLATQAQDRILAGWKSRLPRRSGPYRSGSRLTGTLGPALASPAMVAGTTPHRISFLDPKVLSNEAIHWYRVNYGAQGPNLGKGHEAGAFTISTSTPQGLAVLRDDSPPAPYSWLPRDFRWLDTGTPGTDIFIPYKGPADRQGKGVRAARFTDLGLESIAKNFGDEYHAMMNEHASTIKNRRKARQIGVSMPIHYRRNPWA